MRAVRCVLAAGAVAVSVALSGGSVAQADDPAPAAAPQEAYAPCSQVTWAYVAAGEPRAASTIGVDIEQAVARVAALSGLDFVKAVDGTPPDIVFDWAALGEYPLGTQAVAWRSRVTFATGSEMARNRWAGFQRKVVGGGYGSYDVGVGRGWLIIHEIMHSLGFAHSDEIGSVMAPTASIVNLGSRAAGRREMRSVRVPGLSAGDLAGFASMYPRDHCATPAATIGVRRTSMSRN
jgi:hypothetical protein